MNKWKIGFWIILILLFIITAFSFFEIVDQGVTITYMKEGYSNTENDLDCLSKIINETDLSKGQIKKVLKQHSLFEFMDFSNDTVSLFRVNLIFENEKLKKVIKEW